MKQNKTIILNKIVKLVELLFCVLFEAVYIIRLIILDQTSFQPFPEMPAMLAYGTVVLVLLYELLRRSQPVAEKYRMYITKGFQLKAGIYVALCSLMIFTVATPLFGFILILLLAVFALLFHGSGRIKLLLTFTALWLIMFSFEILCAVDVYNSRDKSLTEILFSKDFINYFSDNIMKMFSGSVTMCWLPIIGLYIVAATVSDEILIDEAQYCARKRGIDLI